MERLEFELECQEAVPAGPAAPTPPAVVVGVVASGNLEVLVEPGAPPRRPPCRARSRSSGSSGRSRPRWRG